MVLAAGCAAVLFHEILGHPLEADAGASPLSALPDARVAVSDLEVVDDARRLDLFGGYERDDEGTAPRPVKLVASGLVGTRLTDRAHAPATGSTGHGRRAGPAESPLPRGSNVVVSPGSADPEEMLRRLGNGIWIEEFRGGSVEVSSGTFRLRFARARRVRRGRFADELGAGILAGELLPALARRRARARARGARLPVARMVRALGPGRARRRRGSRRPDPPPGGAARPVNADDLKGMLAKRSPGQWELFRKSAESREADSVPGFERAAWRREEGWAARWWEHEGPRFAAASSAEDLAAAIPEAARVAVAVEAPPAWPAGTAALSPEPAVEPPPALFADLARAVAAAARGEAVLARLSLRRGAAEERIVNAGGLDVAQRHRVLDGVAVCIGRRGGRAREVRLPFRWDGEPEHRSPSRGGSPTPPRSRCRTARRPSRAASFCSIRRWERRCSRRSRRSFCARSRRAGWRAGRRRAAAVGIADDATPDAPFDGEGVPTRRVPLVADGALVGRLHDLSSARRAGARPTGHGVRPSFRMPPAAGPRRIFFEGTSAVSPAELLSRVTRGLFASALTAPARVDLALDRYDIEFTGVSVVAGRAQGPVAGARVSGRLSELLGRIAGLSTDLQFFPAPFPAGSPTLYVERASFS